jgi:hypothetical protein
MGVHKLRSRTVEFNAVCFYVLVEIFSVLHRRVAETEHFFFCICAYDLASGKVHKLKVMVKF